jgi:hypothetical protein
MHSYKNEMIVGMLIIYKPAYYMQSFALGENMGNIKTTQIILQTKKENCLQVNIKIRKYINMTRKQISSKVIVYIVLECPRMSVSGNNINRWKGNSWWN